MAGWLAVFITVLCSAVQCIEWLTKLVLIKAPLAIDTLACMHAQLPATLTPAANINASLANSLQASLCLGTLTSQCETPQALAC